MPWDNLFLIVPPYLPRAPAVWGLQKLLLAKLSQLRNAVLTSTAGLPPSLRERLRENLLSARAFIAKRLAKAVLGPASIAPVKTIIAPPPKSLSLSAHADS